VVIYPVKIGKIDTALCNQRHQFAFIRPRPDIGGVDIADLHHNNPERYALQRVCKESGFVFSDCPGPYSNYHYCIGSGSVLSHDDKGMGLTACALIATLPLVRGDTCNHYECEFITHGKKQALTLRVGDVFVFNADHWHTWVANCSWVLVQQHVSKLRTKR
jgi:hypothetical protein